MYGLIVRNLLRRLARALSQRHDRRKFITTTNLREWGLSTAPHWQDLGTLLGGREIGGCTHPASWLNDSPRSSWVDGRSNGTFLYLKLATFSMTFTAADMC